MIDEELLLEEIEKSMNDNPHTDGKIAMNHTTEHQHFMVMVNRQPKVGEWIPCEERLPQNLSDALVTFKAMLDGGTHDGEYVLGVGIGVYLSWSKEWGLKTNISIKDYGVKILAWKPLPDIYKA